MHSSLPGAMATGIALGRQIDLGEQADQEKRRSLSEGANDLSDSTKTPTLSAVTENCENKQPDSNVISPPSMSWWRYKLKWGDGDDAEDRVT